MVVQQPAPAVYDAFIDSTARITRRLEIYEKDAATPWRQNKWNSLLGGNVTVDYSRDDRRNAEFTLNNFDGSFDHAPNGFWYDKVFKFFYGIETPVGYWECPIGVFLPDLLTDDDDGDMKVSCRDYTKKCLDSKFAAATMFTAGTPIESVIKTLALNSGITNFNIPSTGKTLPKDVVYEADTERWKPMKEIANTSGYQIFFDASGALTLQLFRDPFLTPPTLALSVGERGNLIKVGKRASDTSLKNHVVVAGESNDSKIPPVFAEARNTMQGSASSVALIGERTVRYTSALVTTEWQAQQMANTYLQVSCLEEFELNFTSVLFPWLEAGDILENTQPRRGSDMYNPTRYLLSSFALPLDLGSMTGNGKRVTIVL